MGSCLGAFERSMALCKIQWDVRSAPFAQLMEVDFRAGLTTRAPPNAENPGISSFLFHLCSGLNDIFKL